MTTSLPLSIINLRIDQKTAEAAQQTFINLHPDWQREYEAWDDKLKTRFIETILIGRAMNPIWTILNPYDESEGVLDGMHRLTTALDFFGDKFKLISKHFSSLSVEYDKKFFKDLNTDDKSKVKNYNFMINTLDTSYHTNANKRRDMYEILNRSSKPLNDFEFNKVIYNPFYKVINLYKNDLNIGFINKKDKRGVIETEIIDMIVLSNPMPNSWSSVNNLRNRWYVENLGETEESVNTYLTEQQNSIIEKLTFITKIVSYLKEESFFSNKKRTFKKYYLPYKFIICRLAFNLKNISLFNRHIKNIIINLRQKIFEGTCIQEKLECKSRNAMFQKKLMQLIDKIIKKEYNENDLSNRRCFTKTMINKKLKEQGCVCNLCKKRHDKYEGDHIIEWSKGGLTTYENLQVVGKHCHKKKTNLIF